MSRDDDFEIEDCEVVKATDNALLVKSDNFPEKDNELWIPRSQLADTCELDEEGDEGTLIVTGWLARKRGWA